MTVSVGVLFFVPPASDQPVQDDSTSCSSSMIFCVEYARILDRGLSTRPSPLRDTSRLMTHFVTSVVDLLVWSFASLLRNGAHRNGKALYR
jgi:hypothetical protein